MEYRITLAIDLCTALTLRFLAASWWKIHSHVVEFLSAIFARFRVRFQTSPRFVLWILFTVGNVDRDIGRYSDIAVDTRSTVGRYSVDTRSTLGWQSVDISVDSRSTLGRDMVDSRSRCVSADIAFCSPTLRRLFVDTSPTLRRHIADSWSILDQYTGQDFGRSV